MLKTEIDIIDKAISRIDGIAQAVKNWAIVTWTGSLALALSIPDLRRYILLTSVVPLLFWLVNGRWAYYLRSFVYREEKIAKYLNSNDLVESFRQQRMINLIVLDPRGRLSKYREDPEFRRVVNFWRSMRYLENSLLYLGMFLLSIGLGVFFLLA